MFQRRIDFEGYGFVVMFLDLNIFGANQSKILNFEMASKMPTYVA